MVAPGFLQIERGLQLYSPQCTGQPSRTKHYLAPDVNSAKAKKLWSNTAGLQKYKHNSVTTKLMRIL